jgi:hypothetical protein
LCIALHCALWDVGSDHFVEGYEILKLAERP